MAITDRSQPASGRWTEGELLREIAEPTQHARRPDLRDASGRCAHAYLRQVLKDRSESLRLLRFRKSEREKRGASAISQPDNAA